MEGAQTAAFDPISDAGPRTGNVRYDMEKRKSGEGPGTFVNDRAVIPNEMTAPSFMRLLSSPREGVQE